MKKYTVTITDLMGDNGKIEGIDPQEVDLEGMLKEWFPCAPGEEEDPQISECINKLEVNDVIKRVYADDARSTLLGAGMVCPIPAGRCARRVAGVIFLV